MRIKNNTEFLLFSSKCPYNVIWHWVASDYAKRQQAKHDCELILAKANLGVRKDKKVKIGGMFTYSDGTTKVVFPNEN